MQQFSLRFRQPAAGFVELRGIEVADLGHRKGYADFGHPFLPGLFSDQRDASDLGAVGGGEFDVVPKGARVPALEVVELGQQSNLALLGDGGVNGGDESFVVGVVQLAGQFEAEDFWAR